MIINNNINLDNNQEDQLCFYINSDTPQINSLVEVYSCSKVLMHYTNNELFRFDNTNHYIIRYLMMEKVHIFYKKMTLDN